MQSTETARILCVCAWLLVAGCRKPAQTESLVEHFQSSGFTVSAPERALSDVTDNLQAGINLAAKLSEGQPTMRAVELDGERVIILRFESEKDAARLPAIRKPTPLPARYRAEIGEPRLLAHRNFVLLVMARGGEKDNGAKLDRIEGALRRFNN